jgi:FlaA1/EpsC-like NDP-sugar epimerase
MNFRRTASRGNSTSGSRLSRTQHIEPFGFCTMKSIVLLSMGMLVGYIVLPIILVDIQMDSVMEVIPVAKTEHFQRKMTSNEQNSSPNLRPDNQASRALQVKAAGGMSDAEKRLIEDHDVLSRQSLPTSTTPYVMTTPHLPDHNRKKILVTGGAGFVGSHLVDKLMMEGHEVIVVDNFFTGQKKNIAHWLHHPNFR